MGVLLEYGYDAYPVNPILATKKDDNDGNSIKLYNRTIYSSMKDISNIGIKIDLVNIFRRSDQVETIVNEILDIGDACKMYLVSNGVSLMILQQGKQ